MGRVRGTDRTILEVLEDTSRMMLVKASDKKKEPAMAEERLDLENVGSPERKENVCDQG